MILAVIESPFAGTPAEIVGHRRYLALLMRFCLQHDMAPFASHGLYTQPGVLLDTIPEERKLGMKAGFAWAELLPLVLDAGGNALVVVGMDLGESSGMTEGIERHAAAGLPIRRLWLGPDWLSTPDGSIIKPVRWEPAD